MARVTVEDCVERIQNRFELVLLASIRSREIEAGAELLVLRDHDKNPVVALRELAGGLLNVDALRQKVLRQRPSTSFFESEGDETADEVADASLWAEPILRSVSASSPMDEESEKMGPATYL